MMMNLSYAVFVVLILLPRIGVGIRLFSSGVSSSSSSSISHRHPPTMMMMTMMPALACCAVIVVGILLVTIAGTDNAICGPGG